MRHKTPLRYYDSTKSAQASPLVFYLNHNYRLVPHLVYMSNRHFTFLKRFPISPSIRFSDTSRNGSSENWSSHSTTMAVRQHFLHRLQLALDGVGSRRHASPARVHPAAPDSAATAQAHGESTGARREMRSSALQRHQLLLKTELW